MSVRQSRAASRSQIWAGTWADRPARRERLMARTRNRLSPVRGRKIGRHPAYTPTAAISICVWRGAAARAGSFASRWTEERATPVSGAIPLSALLRLATKPTNFRKQVQGGIDPIEARDAQRAAKRREAAQALTFEQCAKAYIASHEAGWKNDKHRAQWRSTLATYVFPLIGALTRQVDRYGACHEDPRADLDDQARDGIAMCGVVSRSF